MRFILLFCFGVFLTSSKAQTKESQNNLPVQGGYFTSFDGTKIYYEVRGEGKPVLLVHGFIVSSNSWKGTELYKDLLNHGYKIILWTCAETASLTNPMIRLLMRMMLKRKILWH